MILQLTYCESPAPLAGIGIIFSESKINLLWKLKSYSIPDVVLEDNDDIGILMKSDSPRVMAILVCKGSGIEGLRGV